MILQALMATYTMEVETVIRIKIYLESNFQMWFKNKCI